MLAPAAYSHANAGGAAKFMYARVIARETQERERVERSSIGGVWRALFQ